MNIDFSTIARRLQPAALLAITSRLFKQSDVPARRPRRERRSMNG